PRLLLALSPSPSLLPYTPLFRSGRLLGLGLLLCFGLGLGSLGLAQFGIRLGGLDGLLGSVAVAFLALQGAFCSRQPLGGLPVAGHLQQGEDRVGGLGADTDPVTRTLTVDVDQRRLLGGVVLADLLDDAAVALLARIGDHDAVERCPDLAEALQTDLDCHCGGLSCALVGVDRRDVGWGIGVSTVRGHSRTVRGAVQGEYNGLFCQIFRELPNNPGARWVTPGAVRGIAPPPKGA